jgi:cystathionine beta-lyase/cystathionine gamma-synthase
MKTETKCLHAGYEPKNGEPREVPIYQSTTFKYDSSLQMGRLFDLEDSGYFYSRLQNPTNDIVASKIAALEGGIAAMLTSSGQAANFFAVFNICEAGDHLIASEPPGLMPNRYMDAPNHFPIRGPFALHPSLYVPRSNSCDLSIHRGHRIGGSDDA